MVTTGRRSGARGGAPRLDPLPSIMLTGQGWWERGSAGRRTVDGLAWARSRGRTGMASVLKFSRYPRVIPIAVSTAGARRAVGLWPPVSRSVVSAGGRSGGWLVEARSTPRRCVKFKRSPQWIDEVIDVEACDYDRDGLCWPHPQAHHPAGIRLSYILTHGIR